MQRCERGAEHLGCAAEVVGVVGGAVLCESLLEGEQGGDDCGGECLGGYGVVRQVALVSDRFGDEVLDVLLAATLQSAEMGVAEQDAVAKPGEVFGLGARSAFCAGPSPDAVKDIALAVGQLARESVGGEIAPADEDVVLGWEPGMDGPRRNVGAFGDLSDGRALDTLVEGELKRRAGDRNASALVLFLAQALG